jgi:hypothetical protein
MYQIVQEKPRTNRTIWKNRQCAEAMVKILQNVFKNEWFKIVKVSTKEQL